MSYNFKDFDRQFPDEAAKFAIPKTVTGDGIWQQILLHHYLLKFLHQRHKIKRTGLVELTVSVPPAFYAFAVSQAAHSYFTSSGFETRRYCLFVLLPALGSHPFESPPDFDRHANNSMQTNGYWPLLLNR